MCTRPDLTSSLILLSQGIQSVLDSDKQEVSAFADILFDTVNNFLYLSSDAMRRRSQVMDLVFDSSPAGKGSRIRVRAVLLHLLSDVDKDGKAREKAGVAQETEEKTGAGKSLTPVSGAVDLGGSEADGSRDRADVVENPAEEKMALNPEAEEENEKNRFNRMKFFKDVTHHSTLGGLMWERNVLRGLEAER